jgi:hypothetical protein
MASVRGEDRHKNRSAFMDFSFLAIVNVIEGAQLEGTCCLSFCICNVGDPPDRIWT